MKVTRDGAMQGARAQGRQPAQTLRRLPRGTCARTSTETMGGGMWRGRDRTRFVALFAAPAAWVRGIRPYAIVAALVIAAASAASALAAPTCEELAPDSPRYQAKMDELAERAKLSDNAWNRYHESLVSALCTGKRARADKLVDQGFVTVAESERIAAVLDRAYTPKRRSEAGNRYGAAKGRFVEMGACSACADNIAQFYARKPASRCGKLARRALGGDAVAREKLAAFPDWCRWTYETPTASSAPSSSNN